MHREASSGGPVLQNKTVVTRAAPASSVCLVTLTWGRALQDENPGVLPADTPAPELGGEGAGWRGRDGAGGPHLELVPWGPLASSSM